MNILNPKLSVQIASADLVKAEGKALLSVAVKNTGSKPLVGIVVLGVDNNGKRFSLALPPASPGETSGNTLIIPLGVSNIVLDASGNNNHGVIDGAMWLSDPIHGTVLFFDGNDRVYVSNPRGLVSRYVSGAVLAKLTSFTYENQFAYVESSGSPSKRWFYLSSWPRSEEGYNGIHGGVLTTAGTWGRSFALSNMLQLNTWHSITAVFNCEEGIMKCFLDWNEKQEWGIGTGDIPGTPVAIWIGQTPEGYQHLTGCLAGVSLHSHPLTDEEAKFHLKNRNMPVTKGLVLWFPLNEGSNAPFSFTTGNTYALTITAYSLDGSVFSTTMTAKCR